MDIRIVYLQSSNFSFCNEFEPIKAASSVNMSQTKMGTLTFDIRKNKEDSNIVSYEVEAGFRYLAMLDGLNMNDEIEVGKCVVAEVVAVFKAEYEFDGFISPDELATFGEGQVHYDVYPYWREYCQSTCARMMLPTTIMPELKSLKP